MKKFISVLITFAMMLSMGVVAFAEETVTEVSDFNGLVAAMANGGNIKLTDNITTTAAITTSGITATIDLNGKTLTIGAGDNKFNDASNITIKNGNISITGVTVSGNAIFCLDEYEETLVTTLTLDNVNLTGNGYSSAYGIFYIGDSSVLNVNGGEWNLSNDTFAAGGVFKADDSKATLNITGTEMTLHNVRRVVTYAATTIEDATIAISGDADGVDAEMEHGFNRSPLTIKNSTVTMENMVGRGITAEDGEVSIENSTVTISNVQEATIDVRNNQTVTVDDTSTVVIDKAATITDGGTIDENVKVDASVGKVAKIGDTYYKTLEEAIAAVPSVNAAAGETLPEATEIILLKDTNGGYDIGNSKGTKAKNIILDLDGHTLTLDTPVGSKGTESQGIRVLSRSKLEIKDGTVEFAADKHVLVGIANYGTLSLNNVELGSGADVIYTINNGGELTLSGETTVPNGQPEGSLAIALGVYLTYDNGVNGSVNIDDKDVQVGDIEVDPNTGNKQSDKKVVLNISAGSIGNITEVPAVEGKNSVAINGNITGGTFNSDVSKYLADGVALDTDGTVKPVYTVTFVADGKTVETQTVISGKDAVLPEVPRKLGYRGKWNDDGKNITEDTVITAEYTKKATTSTGSGITDIDRDDSEENPNTGAPVVMPVVAVFAALSGAVIFKRK